MNVLKVRILALLFVVIAGLFGLCMKATPSINWLAADPSTPQAIADETSGSGG